MPYIETRGNWSQRKQRRGQRFTDQHGREYHAELEIKTGEPCGLIGALYQAPLVVPLKFLKRSKDPARPYDLVIDYAQWLAEIREEAADWRRRATAAAVKRYGDQFDASKPWPADILELFPRPKDHEEPVIAARQGNRWVLGLTTKPDPRLAPYFEPTVFDPHYLEKQEPDFRDLPTDLAADMAAVVGDEDEETVAGDDALDLEDELDPDAVGGKRVPVGAPVGGAGRGKKPQSKGAKAKAEWRARQKAAGKGGASDDE